MKSDRLIPFGIFIFVTLFVIVLTQGYWFTFSPLQRIELSLIDSRFKGRDSIKFTPKVVLISISQESGKSIPPPYNAWPFPRSIYAKLVKNLTKAGARAIGFDLVMSNSDRFDPANDSLFIKAIRECGNAVVAGKIPENDNSEKYAYTYNDNFDFQNIFFKADSSIGIVNIKKDIDGIIRRYEPAWTLPFDPPLEIPSFAFAVLNKYFSKEYSYVPEKKGQSFIYLNHTIPVYEASSFLINFYGPSGTFPRTDIINVVDDAEFITNDEKELQTDINIWDDPQTGLINTGLFKDKIVLVGSFDPLEKDLFNISFTKGNAGDNLIYGVEIYANIIQSILDRNLLFREPAYLSIIVIIFFTFITFYSRTFLKSKINNLFLFELTILFSSALFIFFIYRFSFICFNKFNYVTGITGPSFAVMLAYITGTTYHFITEKRQSGMIRKMFRQYVNSSLLDSLISNPDQLKLGGVRKELTVFFSDIAGFTNLSESKSSEELVALLNEYLSAMTEIIFDFKGTLDKYQGDAIMAIWGAPVPVDDHALLCCRAAIKMQHKLIELKMKWESEGQDVIKVRMGVNTGEMIVGNMGGKERFDYTVIGDNVNLASRLEGVNKEYYTNMIISEQTYEQVKSHVYVRELDYIRVKGKNKPIKIFELVQLNDSPLPRWKKEVIEWFELGLASYRNKDFYEANEYFERSLFVDPNDGPSKVFIDRCYKYILYPPSEEWSGVHIMTTK